MSRLRSFSLSLAAAGQTDEALDAARRLLDLEPDNVANIRDLAKAYLERGNRAAAAAVAARLFSAAVQEKKTPSAGGPAGGPGMGPTSVAMMSMQATWSSVYGRSYAGQASRSNLDAAVHFFRENGLMGELQEILTQQLAAAMGLGGRHRQTGSAAERARSTVRQRLRAVLQRIAIEHPGLADHLTARVRTGTFCAYQPDPERPIVWDLAPSGRR